MNTNTRYTLKQAQTDMGELRSEIRDIARSVEVLVAALQPAAPAKPAARKPAPKARKAAAKPKASVKVRALCKDTRKAFVAAAAKEGVDFGSWSTKAIAAACVEDPSLVPAGFRIGEGYAALYA